MEKGETGVDISSREIGRNIKDEAAENDGEDNKNGRLPNKCLALSARFSSVPSGVTVRVLRNCGRNIKFPAAIKYKSKMKLISGREVRRGCRRLSIGY